jgi:hypothetical protein
LNLPSTIAGTFLKGLIAERKRKYDMKILKSAVICEFDYLEIREIIADVWRVRYGSLQNLFHSLYDY